MDGSAAAAVIGVGVDLDYQRRPLHALLRGEVCAQTVDRDEDLGTKKGQKSRSVSGGGRAIKQAVGEMFVK